MNRSDKTPTCFLRTSNKNMYGEGVGPAKEATPQTPLFPKPARPRLSVALTTRPRQTAIRVVALSDATQPRNTLRPAQRPMKIKQLVHNARILLFITGLLLIELILFGRDMSCARVKNCERNRKCMRNSLLLILNPTENSSYTSRPSPPCMTTSDQPTPSEEPLPETRRRPPPTNPCILHL